MYLLVSIVALDHGGAVELVHFCEYDESLS